MSPFRWSLHALQVSVALAGSLEACLSNSASSSSLGSCSPTPSALDACNAQCAANGFCCDGSTYASSHGLLSCNHGCRMAWYASELQECIDHCTLGNSGGCSYDHAEAGTLHKCGDCQTGCSGSTSRDECARGCELAHNVGGFYNALYYTPPPPPPPHPHASCTVATGMSEAFVRNIEGTGHWSASAVFDDELFAYVHAGWSTLHNPRGILCVDGESSPRTTIELFDDGLGGDDVAGDGRFTRSCLSICPGLLVSHGVLEECINCGGGGERLLGILSASLRGKIAVHTPPDYTPISHPGCDSVSFTSHGIFAVCPDILPQYPKFNAWDIQAPNRCVPCRKAFDHFGEAFDFFSLRGRNKINGAGDNYIRVRDTVHGIGFQTSQLDNYRWSFGARSCTDVTRVQGVAWGQYETGYTHELAHWLGLDFNSNGNLPEYHFSDGAHLSGHCTIHGPLQGPVWCWDQGYPCAVRYNDGDAIVEPNHDSSGAFDGTFRYVSYASAEGKGNQRHSQILLYAAGLIPKEQVNETYYCLAGTVDDSDPARITASQVDSFDIDRFVQAHGPRSPAYPKPLSWSIDRDIRVGQITVSDKDFTEAELTWWTLWNRHYEDDVAYDATISHGGGWGSSGWGWGRAGWNGGFPTWTYATNGLSRSKTKLRGIDCESPGPASSSPFRPRSCDEADDPPATPCDRNNDPFMPPSPPHQPPSPPSPPAHPHWLPAPPPPPHRPMMTIWLVYYDFWIGGGSGVLEANGERCLSACEADPTCLGVQLTSDQRSQCYKLESHHLDSLGDGHVAIGLEQAAALDAKWSVFVMRKVPAPAPPSPPPSPSPAPGICATGSATTCTLTAAQQSQRCSCQFTWEDGCVQPTGVQLVCAM